MSSSLPKILQHQAVREAIAKIAASEGRFQGDTVKKIDVMIATHPMSMEDIQTILLAANTVDIKDDQAYLEKLNVMLAEKFSKKTAADVLPIASAGAKKWLGFNRAPMMKDFLEAIPSTIGAGALKVIFILPAFVVIADSVNTIKKAVKEEKTTRGRIKIVAMALKPSGALVENILGVGETIASVSKNIGSSLGTMSVETISRLSIACSVLGAAFGAFSAMVGMAMIGKHTYDIVKTHNVKIKKCTEEIRKLEAERDTSSLSAFKTLRLAKLKQDLSASQIARTRCLFKIAANVCVTICGALAVAATFTQGASLIGVAAVATTLTIVGIGIAAAGTYKQKKAKKELEAQKPKLRSQFEELLKQTDNPAELKQIVEDLKLNDDASADEVRKKLYEEFKDLYLG